MDWQEQLISVYLLVCKEYEQNLSSYIARISNYSNLDFSDVEVMTIYLFGVIRGYGEVKEIYNYTSDHLISWFPKLPSYTAFIQRINKISHLFEVLTQSLFTKLPKQGGQDLPAVIDSFPIILAKQGRRFKAKVAPEIAGPNGYCASKKLYYYGVKLHMLGGYQSRALPIPMCLAITDAGIADIKILDEMIPKLPGDCRVFADKAYQRENKAIKENESFTIYTPVKKEKGEKTLDVADRLLSKAISSVRQPIESLFNWIEEKTSLQIASKVRSFEGLMVHVFGKIAVALLLLSQKFCS
jgi:IS5 family transposase